MRERKVPLQSLIDHIKTAVDVDPWAKEMAEDLLKDQEARLVEIDGQLGGIKYGCCPKCGKGLNAGGSTSAEANGMPRFRQWLPYIDRSLTEVGTVEV